MTGCCELCETPTVFCISTTMSSYLTASPFLAAIQKARATSGRLWARGASLITPRVYLSDLWTACDEKEMARLEITHVISVIEHRPALPDQIPIQRRLQVFLADRSDANILTYFEETNKFIMDALAENETNKVLVWINALYSKVLRPDMTSPGTLPTRHQPQRDHCLCLCHCDDAA